MNEHEESLEEQVKRLNTEIKHNQNLLTDLIDYLQRTDHNFVHDIRTLDTWHDRLINLRYKEKLERELGSAKQLLRDNGYIVAKNTNELDVQQMKQWLQSKDIPF